MKSLFIPAIAAALSSSAYGVVVFADDFEAGTAGIISQQPISATQDVLTYNVANTSRNFNGSIWVDTTTGFGSDRNGLIDGGAGGTDFGNFTPDAAGPQAYAFRYTNSGLTSDVGVIGTLALGQTITVTFDVFTDGFNGGTPFDASIVTFDVGGVRNDMSAGGYTNGVSAVLARMSGDGDGDTLTGSGEAEDVLVTSTYQTLSFSYTVDGTETTLGHDIAIRFDGATTAANIDNVSVDISAIPEPAAAMLGGLGALLLLRRRRA